MPYSMVRSKIRSPAAVVGIVLVLIGIILALSSLPIFTFMQDAMREIPKSETIMDYSFNIHQSQDKLVQFQMNIGQKLNILATGNNYFNFSISNYTTIDQPIQPDQPDVVYLSLDNTASINSTWSPTIRSAQPGSYYLVFLARNASSDSPVQVAANVNKTWTEIQTYQIPYQKPLLDSIFGYAGGAISLSGAAIFVVAFSRPDRPRKHVR